MSTPVHKYEFNVNMTCGGCSGAVERVLKKNTEVTSYTVSLEDKRVLVESTATYDAILEVIKKTGKTVLSGKTIE